MRKNLLTLGVVLMAAVAVSAQNAAELDLLFDPENNANGAGESITLQPDGKIIVTGHFTSKIVRLNSDGSKDLSFNQPSDWPAILKDVALLPDGKLILVGNFTEYDGVTVNHIVRLNSDGTVDNTFNQGAGANNYVNVVSLQSDGKIIIGGVFTEYNGTSQGGIARLNADGTLDNTFDSGTGLAGISAEAETLTIQPDGKILIAGKFNSYNGNPSSLSARLNEDGSFDGTYTAPSLGGGNAAERIIADMAIQSDGKIIVGGHFGSIAGVSRNGIARLNADGTVDNTFDPGSGAQITFGTLVASVCVMQNGKILIGGKFNSFDGVNRKCIVRLNSDGSLDTDFDPGTGVTDFLPYAIVSNFEIQTDGKILIGGDFDEYNDIVRFNVARLLGDGETTLVGSVEDESLFQIFPNPAAEIVTISDVPKLSNITITDSYGRIKYEQLAMNGYEKIDVSNFTCGLYLVHIENNSNTSTKKLLIKH